MYKYSTNPQRLENRVNRTFNNRWSKIKSQMGELSLGKHVGCKRKTPKYSLTSIDPRPTVHQVETVPVTHYLPPPPTVKIYIPLSWTAIWLSSETCCKKSAEVVEVSSWLPCIWPIPSPRYPGQTTPFLPGPPPPRLKRRWLRATGTSQETNWK